MEQEYKKYLFKFDNNENILIKYLTKENVNEELNKNNWNLVYETKGHFSKFYKKNDEYLSILNFGQGILTDNEYIFKKTMKNELIIFNIVNDDISFYLIIEDEKLVEFIKLNNPEKIELFFDGIDPKYTEFYKLDDNRYLYVDAESKIGFLFINKIMMDNWHKLIYGHDFSVFIPSVTLDNIKKR